ncbi:hypothetical protein ABW38_26555 [Achromobacter xylosoxidans]|uniref:hypothetical protein n=2 Tax=Alcaligenes xylosoxydans xylosoxydans TaxID=85698 RepID=UPI0006AC1359|nr:hypothetical protein [Achromobacter xylosoxidans]KOQ24177.1 hypothetical protein ABW36_23815 [Achromobacter xylosoxidans]KOQ31009.1 hypothetical protein ABW34_02255 [Achromobacter xylosoxidans]KOQ37918.1 hypothetical protein ABW38_26555 [Achromobacter xylosoxidans]KOQ45218.1 hypothetical protein ABW37_07040 [Achromobacter xylosoxidans]KOQ50628.1 hypothetical protein ABW39_05105 [Achromobacter xylosoxidans]
MNARQAFLDDPARVADYGHFADEVDANAPTVTKKRAVELVRACLENETAGAFGQSARIWADCLLDEVSDNQAAAALVLLAGTVSMSIHRFLSQHLENYIEAEANRLLAEMDPDEAEAYL